jgi:hypothetical protein
VQDPPLTARCIVQGLLRPSGTIMTNHDASGGGGSDYGYFVCLGLCLLVVAATAPLNLFLLILISLIIGDGNSTTAITLRMFLTIAMQTVLFGLFLFWVHLVLMDKERSLTARNIRLIVLSFVYLLAWFCANILMAAAMTHTGSWP